MYIKLFLLIFSFFLFSCEEAGNTAPDEELEEIVEEESASIFFRNPPANGSALPSEFSLNAAYSIPDSFFQEGHSYSIKACFETADGCYEAADFPLTEQSKTSFSMSFALTSEGLPTDAVVPFNLSLALYDTTVDPAVKLCSSSSIQYNGVAYGNWYEIGSKIVITNTQMWIYHYKGSGRGYVADMRGSMVRLGHNKYQTNVEQEFDSDTGEWVDIPEEYLSRYVSVDYLNVQKDGRLHICNEAGDITHNMLPSESGYTYDADYSGKWWTDDLKIDPADNGSVLWFSDNYFQLQQDDQQKGEDASFPVYEIGTVSDNAGTLTLNVTHVGSGEGFEEIDSGKEYTFTYVYDPDAVPDETLVLTGGPFIDGGATVLNFDLSSKYEK